MNFNKHYHSNGYSNDYFRDKSGFYLWKNCSVDFQDKYTILLVFAEVMRLTEN